MTTAMGGEAGISTKNVTEGVTGGAGGSWQDVQVSVHGVKMSGGWSTQLGLVASQRSGSSCPRAHDRGEEGVSADWR
jgi:hypothetical protein